MIHMRENKRWGYEPVLDPMPRSITAASSSWSLKDMSKRIRSVICTNGLISAWILRIVSRNLSIRNMWLPRKKWWKNLACNILDPQWLNDSDRMYGAEKVSSDGDNQLREGHVLWHRSMTECSFDIDTPLLVNRTWMVQIQNASVKLPAAVPP